MSKPQSEFIVSYVKKRIAELSQKDTGQTRAELAKIRRGLGKMPYEVPESWGAVFKYMQQDEFDNLIGKRLYNAAEAENAVFTAMTLFAMACQGRENKSVNNEEVRFGKALSILAGSKDDDRIRIYKYLTRLVSCTKFEGFVVHLRRLCQMLHTVNVGMNYADLARDLYWLQFNKECRYRVILKWNHDFHNCKED